MPADEKTVSKIACDNPDCPGNDLKATQKEGWLFVSAEVYGQPTVASVFCTTKCASVTLAKNPTVVIGETPPEPVAPA